MPFVSVTRLKVRSIFILPAFMRSNNASAKQLIITPGFLGGKELIDKGLVFWTLTAWNDDAAMKTFRNSPAHRQAMQHLPDWCSEASYHHWIKEDALVPGWKEASEKLIKEGKLSKVRNPTPNHTANRFPPIRWTKLEKIFVAKESI